MRRLILMRHGIADDHHSGSDSTRPLTPQGKELQSKVCEAMKTKHIEVDGILFSPLKRAKESAEILFHEYPKAGFIEEPALGEVFDSYTVLKKVTKKNYQNALLVGHEPTLALLASHLMKDYKPFKFDKSGAVIIDFPNELKFGEGDFKFYLSPKEL